jgi:hypothetical protein
MRYTILGGGSVTAEYYLPAFQMERPPRPGDGVKLNRGAPTAQQL